MDTSLTSTMSNNLITVSEGDDLNAAYALMVRRNIRHLPVTNEDGQITGILSERDLQRAMISRVSGHGSLRMESCEFPPEARVRDYMSWPVKTVSQDTPLKSVCDRMIKEKVSAYLVMNKAQVVGIVTSEDLLRVLHRLLDDEGSQLKLTLNELMQNPAIGQFANALSGVGTVSYTHLRAH
ncbi:MAG: CBS domain-containing protein, partial [Bdellovibrionaceae bacterium]|nr:CBS domain-containing protein [Pseudobdellovibrionaceae bacterium]